MRILSLPNWAPLLLLAVSALVSSIPAYGQEERDSDPSAALIAALGGACKGNEAQLARYLTADNAAAYRALAPDQRLAMMKRFSLADEPGHPLLSSDTENHPVLRCETPSVTVEFHLGAPRVRENLAFVPVTVPGAPSTQFGMIREEGTWKILSLGLVLIDIPMLSRQWAAQDLAAREAAAVKTLEALAGAIGTYQRAYGGLPESLAQLGPAPKNEISPEQANLINAQLASGSQAGYKFRYRIVPGEEGAGAGFELAATPEEYGKTGKRSFFRDAAEKIHGADKEGAMARADDPLLSSEQNE